MGRPAGAWARDEGFTAISLYAIIGEPRGSLPRRAQGSRLRAQGSGFSPGSGIHYSLTAFPRNTPNPIHSNHTIQVPITSRTPMAPKNSKHPQAQHHQVLGELKSIDRAVARISAIVDGLDEKIDKLSTAPQQTPLANLDQPKPQPVTTIAPILPPLFAEYCPVFLSCPS